MGSHGDPCNGFCCNKKTGDFWCDYFLKGFEKENAEVLQPPKIYCLFQNKEVNICNMPALFQAYLWPWSIP